MPQIMGLAKRTGLDTSLVTGLTKAVEERLLAGLVGNANPMSAVVILAIGGAIQYFGKGRYINAIGSGFTIDGVEDLLASLPQITGMGGGNSGGSVI